MPGREHKKIFKEAFYLYTYQVIIIFSFLLNYCRNSEMNCALRDHPASMATMQSFNYMVKALRHVFKHLKTHELLSASRVCTAWNTIAMDKTLVSYAYTFYFLK